MKRLILMSLFILSSLSHADFNQSYRIKHVNCSDFGQLVIGEACEIQMENIQSQERLRVIVDIYDFYNKFGYSSQQLIEKEVIVMSEALENCPESYYPDLGIQRFESCLITPRGKFRDIFNL